MPPTNQLGLSVDMKFNTGYVLLLDPDVVLNANDQSVCTRLSINVIVFQFIVPPKKRKQLILDVPRGIGPTPELSSVLVLDD